MQHCINTTALDIVGLQLKDWHTCMDTVILSRCSHSNTVSGHVFSLGIVS